MENGRDLPALKELTKTSPAGIINTAQAVFRGKPELGRQTAQRDRSEVLEGDYAVSQTVQARHDRTLMSADLYNKGNLWKEMGTWTIALQ